MSSDIDLKSQTSKTDVEEQLIDGEDFLSYMSPLLNSMRIFGLYFRSATAATAPDDIAASASTEQREELNDETIIEVVMNESNNGGD